MTEQILGAMVIALTSGIIGNVIGTKDSVKKSMCDERRIACNRLVIEKIENLSEKVETLAKVINDKHFGLII
jgi:hypothetical protein